MFGARFFVIVVFLTLTAAFFAPTIVLLSDYGAAHWYAFASIYSHAFLFFPTIALVALVAFYTPATIFVDFYWHHVKFGKLRLMLGLVAVTALSIYVAGELTGHNPVVKALWKSPEVAADKSYVPALWDLHPTTLLNDTGTPANCALTKEACARQPVLRSLKILRQVAQSRTGLSAFARNCTSDPLLEDPPERKLARYCFPLLRKVDGESCCFAQNRFSRELSEMFRDEKQHSRTRFAHAATLPFKTFFLLMVLMMGVLLATWRAKLDRFYESYMARVENGILIGATAMLFWPIANQAFLQSSRTLYGPFGGGVYQDWLGPVLSAGFGLWALLILFFFFRHKQESIELWVKVVGGGASVIAAVRYDEIVDLAVRYLGAGAFHLTFVILAGVGLALYFSSYFWPKRPLTSAADPLETKRTPPPPGAPITGANRPDR